MKLGLGSAQFGMDYGITNQAGKVSNVELEKIIDHACASKVLSIDTAQEYGDAETRLGNLEVLKKGFRMMSKFSIQGMPNEVVASVKKSVKRIGGSFETLFVHNPDQLLESEQQNAWFDVFDQLIHLGLTKSVGISVYSPATLHDLLPLYRFEAVQVPLNILDQRFCDDLCVSLYEKYDCSVVARSLFLQGVLLSPIDELPSYFSPWLPKFKEIETLSMNMQMSPLELCLHFVEGLDWVDVAIVGCSRCNELKEITLARDKILSLPSMFDYRAIASTDEQLILPTQWQF